MRFPFLRSKDPAAKRSPRAAPADDASAVEAARTRARRRLIGAFVLLVVGVIGFPLLFDTQPRPLPADTPIEVQPRDLAAAPSNGSKPLLMPPPDAGAEGPASQPSASGERHDAPAVATDVPAETPAGVPAPGATAAAGEVAPAAQSPAPAPRTATAPPAAPTLAAPPAATGARANEGARARALLEGAAATAPAAGRFVVQVGAYSEAAALNLARQRVEKLGLKTYTQVIDTDAGKRTRVRIGPYATRDQADAAAAKVKAAGLPAAILAL